MTAKIIPFPVSETAALSPTARAIYRDICRLYNGTNNGSINHSIADGMRCTGAYRHKVVEARQELVDARLLERRREGDSSGPTEWIICKYPAHDVGFQPDGAA